MADIQIAVIDEKDTQIALAVPGIQGPAGAISSGGSANQVFYKVSGTNYDAGWTFIGNANVDAAAAIAGTKISPNFGSQAIVTTGTNTAASFIPTSATIPSNGIYLPGANQVGVATNGTGRLFVNANGRVGVMVTPSTTFFHVYTDAPSTVSAPTICLEGGFNGYGAGIDFASRTSSGGTLVSMAKITADGEAAWTTTASTQDANLRFFTAENGSLGERLRISSAGTMNFVGAGAAGSTQAVSFNGSAPINSLVIDSSGRLGIGTSLPGQKLDVNGEIVCSPNTAGKNTFQFTTNAADDASLIMKSNTTTKVNIQANGTSYFNGGNVGIGASPSGSGGKLAIFNATSGEHLSFEDTATLSAAAAPRLGANQNSLVFKTSPNTGAVTEVARIRADGMFEVKGAGVAGSSPAFSVNGSAPANSAIIDTSGRLLVGTSTSSGPGSTLQVRNDASAAAMDIFRSDATTGTSIFGLNKSRGTAATPLEVANNDVLGYIAFRGYDGTTYQDAAYIHAECDGTWTDGGDTSDNPGRLVFSTTADGAASPTERMRIKADGDVSIVTGNLIIGTAGKGIDFSADVNAAGMTSELLDDYEEGTWTFAVTTTTGSVTMNSSLNNCWYIKIGALVTVGGKVTVGSVSSPTGAIVVTLPFAMTDLAEEADFNAGTVTVGSSVSKNERDFAILTQGGTEMRIYIADVALLSSSNANAQQLQANSIISFQLSYYSA